MNVTGWNAAEESTLPESGPLRGVDFWIDPTKCQELPYFEMAKTGGTGFNDRI